MKKPLFFTIIICLMLSACNNNPPECSASDVKEQVLKSSEIYIGEIFKNISIKNLNLMYIRTRDLFDEDQDSKAYICDAELSVSFAEVENLDMKFQIVYEVGKNSGDERFHVTLRNFQPL